MTPDFEQLIREMSNRIIRIETLLVGIPDTDDGGLCGEVKGIRKTVSDVYEKHDKLSRAFYILVGTLLGSGILGGGAYALLAVIKQ